eukprot:COSAG06_NODE_24850_length_651_cov_0.675725_1_plen_177_part_10
MFERREGCAEQCVRRDANCGLAVVIALTDGYTIRIWPESRSPKPQVTRATATVTRATATVTQATTAPTACYARQAKTLSIRLYASSENDSRKGCLKRPCPCSRNLFNQATVRSQSAAGLAATESQLRPSVSNNVRRNADHDANDPSLGASQGSGACRSPFAQAAPERGAIRRMQRAP